MIIIDIEDCEKKNRDEKQQQKKYRDLCIQEIGLCCDEYHYTNHFRFVTFVVEYIVSRTHLHLNFLSIQNEKILFLTECDKEEQEEKKRRIPRLKIRNIFDVRAYVTTIEKNRPCGTFCRQI